MNTNSGTLRRMTNIAPTAPSCPFSVQIHFEQLQHQMPNFVRITYVGQFSLARVAVSRSRTLDTTDRQESSFILCPRGQ